MAQTFSDIIRGMQHAVNTAGEILQDHQFRMMRQYFNDDGTPHTLKIKLIDGREVNVPKISLIPQNLLAIDELEMSFSVTVANTEVKNIPEGEGNNDEGAFSSGMEEDELSRSCFQVEFSRSSKANIFGDKGVNPLRSHDAVGAGGENKESVHTSSDSPSNIMVKIKFKSTSIPEGAARVQDQLNMSIG